ncbi:MAG: hypothetical protein ACRC0X_07935 [Brevinema sp.]
MLFSACSTIDEDLFFQQAVGAYNLNATGVGFLLRENEQNLLPDTRIEFRGNGLLVAIISDTETENIAQMIELKKARQGLFRLSKTDRFVAMGLQGELWISTTNRETRPENVLFEHLVPIATKIPTQ